MSRAHNGGKYNLGDHPHPETDAEVLDILQTYVDNKFRDTSVADDIVDDDRHLIEFPDGNGPEAANMLFNVEGDLIAQGRFVYPATDHSVQTIWQNEFEIVDTDDGLLVNVSNWHGPTVDTWEKQKRQH